MRYGFPNGINTFVSPRPDRRPDEMNCRYTCFSELLFKPQVKVRRIDTHEDLRRLPQPPSFYVQIGRHQLWKPFQGINIPKNRQRRHRMPGVKALALHMRSADAI